jgi:uncharacterized protein YjiS (DUF1127 family)
MIIVIKQLFSFSIHRKENSAVELHQRAFRKIAKTVWQQRNEKQQKRARSELLQKSERQLSASDVSRL